MKKIIALAVVAAATLIAAPAMATSPFTGVRVEGTVGADDLTKLKDTTDVTYGATVGLDAPVFGGALIAGVEASVDNVFEHKDIGAAARVGVPLGRVLPFASVGYSDFRGLDGVRVGGGLEYALTNNLFVVAQYRYTGFDKSAAARSQGNIGAGIRF